MWRKRKERKRFIQTREVYEKITTKENNSSATRSNEDITQ
jgi:hypothetical protein